MHKSPKFRHFREELSTLAGFHTGTYLVVGERYSNDLAVRAHELIHGRIFDETLDGTLHKVVIALVNESMDESLQRQFNELNDFLFEDVLLPHERSATFLGIKSLLTQDDRDLARNALDSRYRGYYDFFERLLPWPDSTFVGFAIAFAFARFAFSSDRIGKIPDIASLDITHVSKIEGPNARLEAAAHAFSRDPELSSKLGITRLFDECFREAEVDSFDVFDDAEWLERAASGRAETQRVERLVSGRFEQALSTRCNRPLDLSMPIPSWMHAIVRRFAVRSFDVEFPVVEGALQYPPEVAMHYAMEADRELIGQCYRASIPSVDPKLALRLITEYACSDVGLSIVLIQKEDNPRQFKMLASILKDGKKSYVPGTGLDLELETAFGIALYLGEIVEKERIASPLFHVIYSPGVDLTGERVLIPLFDERVAVFYAHLSKAAPPTRGLVMRPLIYARRYWSQILYSTNGALQRFEATMADAAGRQPSNYRVQVLVPDDQSLVPSLAILTPMPEHPYLALARHAAEAGWLRIENSAVAPRGLAECLDGIWQTMTHI